MSEWPPEGCTCTLFREMFSERCQKHLEAQSKIFADKNNKNEVQRSPQTTKTEHFRRPPLRKWWPFCLLRTRFNSMFELCHSRIWPLGSVILPFQKWQHLKVSPVQEKPERFWLLHRGKTSGFRSVSETEPSEKSTEKHHGSIVSGILEAFEHLPKPGDA